MQLKGLMEALDKIHNPTHLGEKFGRHGDLKPENILWYRNTADDPGILVIADFGLTAVHRAISRSKVDNETISRTPEYRPPECDIKGAKISRRYDIWTLGCVFMEMIVWFLGGCTDLEQFCEDRVSLDYMSGVDKPLFYEIQGYTSGGRVNGEEVDYVVTIKEAVINVRLRSIWSYS